MKITTGTVVPKYVLQEMTALATTPATLKGKYHVYRAGRENTAKNQFASKGAAKTMEIAQGQETVYAERAGREPSAMSVRDIRPVNTAPVSSPGSAPAKRAGEASSVTKI